MTQLIISSVVLMATILRIVFITKREIKVSPFEQDILAGAFLGGIISVSTELWKLI